MKTNLTQKIITGAIICTLFNCSLESEESNIEAFSTTEGVELSDSTIPPPCPGLDPQARLTNNGTSVFSFEIYTNEGEFLAGEYGIGPGEISEWLPFEEGEVLFSLESENETDIKISQNMEECEMFSMEIDSDNQLVEE
ncbi:hypothetical protein [Mangrovimonas sp. DI 80]|uniref:hypothetical protein n=1 Tax=Mangrovimonas sp. DI 80 TaxID=1779330 RepID=UPI0009764E88|nr:hypothetical protein [Mangrovimonas sp. DI 80]OMP30809.1 hypothetical protein BKM32_11295 [Mangrovimonas sp. DI 80]